MIQSHQRLYHEDFQGTYTYASGVNLSGARFVGWLSMQISILKKLE